MSASLCMEERQCYPLQAGNLLHLINGWVSVSSTGLKLVREGVHIFVISSVARYLPVGLIVCWNVSVW